MTTVFIVAAETQHRTKLDLGCFPLNAAKKQQHQGPIPTQHLLKPPPLFLFAHSHGEVQFKPILKGKWAKKPQVQHLFVSGLRHPHAYKTKLIFFSLFFSVLLL